MKAIVALVAAAAAAGAIVATINFAPPSPERQRDFDARRVADLSRLSAAVDAYYAKHADIPASMDSLVRASALLRVPTDPHTHLPYYYWASGATSYRLCATFAHPSDTSAAPPAIGAHTWRHGSGESCFDVVVTSSAP